MSDLVLRARHRIGATGLNRSTLLRRLSQIGHPRLRELRARALEPVTVRDRGLGVALSVLERGVLRVPSGYAHGFQLSLRHLPLSHAHFGSLAYGNLESSVQEAMLRHLGAGGVFYDIGANLGFFSLLGARLAGPSGAVYAFDPTPDNAAAIRVNAALNEFANVVVVEQAVGARSGSASVQVVDDQSWSKLLETGEHPFTERVIAVSMVSVDEFVAAGARPPTVVKIDVEGYELEVLEGMRETLARFRPAVICELHDTHAEFVAFMREAGYRPINLEGVIPVELEGASAHALALPITDPGD